MDLLQQMPLIKTPILLRCPMALILCYDTVSAFLGSNYQITIDSLIPANCPNLDGQVSLSIPVTNGMGSSPTNSWILQQNNVTLTQQQPVNLIIIII